MKKCKTCSIEKPLTEFYTRKSGKENNIIYRKECKICRDQYVKNWIIKNKSRRLEISKKYRDGNKESCLKLVREYKKKKYQTDLIFRLKDNISSSIRRYLTVKKSKKTMDILGCNIEFFIEYIESKFTEGMTWDNHTKFGWHLDHIIPLASAITEEDLYKLNHYTNFQPLWWRDNLSKSYKIIEYTNHKDLRRPT